MEYLTDSDGDDLPVPERPAPVKTTRGGRGRKRAFMKDVPAEEVAAALQTVSASKLPRDVALAVPEHRHKPRKVVPFAETNPLIAFGPINASIGSDVQKRLCLAVSQALQRGIEYSDPVIEAMFTHRFTSASSISRFCSVPCQRVRNAVIESGAAAVYGGTWLAGSLLCCVGEMIDKEIWRPVLMVRRMRYDETPTRVRLPKDVSQPNEQSGKSGTEVVEKGTDVVEHAKVLQTEFILSFLVHDELRGNYNLLHASVPTTLQAVDRTTAENTRSCLQSTMDRVPELRRVALKFPFRVHHACTDKYSANIKTEKAVKSDQPDFVKHHVFCSVHRLATSISAANSLFPDETAGILSVALACREVGAAGKLRDILRQIFQEKLVVRAAFPNPLWKQHRLEVYDLFLPLAGEAKWNNAKRRFILNHFLNGNLTDPDIIEHFCPFGHCLNEEEVRSCFARLVPNALIPSKPPKYARGRWTNYDLAVNWCGLLEAHHSLLKQVIVQYTGPPQKIPQLPKRIADLPPGEDSDGSDKWDGVLKDFLADEPLPIHDTHDGKSEGSQGEREADSKGGGFNWIEFNKRQKAQAGKFVNSDPYASIAIMQQVCRHMLAVMHYFLLVSGDEWERRQEHISSQGGMRKYKVLECANGEALQRAFESLVTYCLTAHVPHTSSPEHVLCHDFEGLVCHAPSGSHGTSWVSIPIVSTFAERIA